MHFVSAQSEEDQLTDIIEFLKDNFVVGSLESRKPKSAAFDDFGDKIEALAGKSNYKAVLEHILEVKDDILQLPTSHKNSQLTIQRLVLLVLPILKYLENRVAGKDSDKKYSEVKTLTLRFCDMLEGSEYPLSIKVNS